MATLEIITLFLSNQLIQYALNLSIGHALNQSSWRYRIGLSSTFLLITGLTKVRHLVPPRETLVSLIMAAMLTFVAPETYVSSTVRDAIMLGSLSCFLTYLATRYDAIRGERVNIIRWFSLRGSKIGYSTTGYLDETMSTCYYIILASAWARVAFGTTFVWSTSIQDLILCTTIAITAILLHRAPVSLPGGPRQGASRIRREPVWCSKEWEFGGAEWTFVGADRSHEKSKHQNCKYKLSGEASGRQTWWYDTVLENNKIFTFNPAKNPNTSDRVFREQQIKSWQLRNDQKTTTTTDDGNNASQRESKGGAQNLRTRSTQSTIKAIEYFRMLQCEDGHWAGDYGGPHFLLPGLVIVWYVTGKAEHVLNVKQRDAMSHYLRVHQQRDGGWGTHIESPSTMFGSVLCYVALRLLGAHKDDEACIKARQFIRKNGGALYTSSWAKFGLCLLGVMDWRGHNPVPPEFFLLPNWFPFHPGRMWCHARMVYLPMSVLYGNRVVYEHADKDPITRSLREELYVEKYEQIEWTRTRHWIADMDNYSPIGTFMRKAQDLMMYYENYGGFIKRFLRERGVRFAMEYIRAEDRQTNFVDIGPVNKVYNMLCVYVAEGKNNRHPDFLRHSGRIRDYLWVAEDGMKMQGYNGSQTWDTSFAIQAVVESGLAERFPKLVRGAWTFLEKNQILSTSVSQSTDAYTYESPEQRHRYYRHVSEGGWPFSNSAHGWPISDCTAEGLKAVLAMRDLKCLDEASKSKITRRRLANAVNVLLTLQNSSGGWATYENNRGYGWYEILNPSEVFGDIMIDYSYVECSMASMTGLASYLHAFPNDPRSDEISNSLRRGREFIKSIQRADGSWYGSWACCFAYGCWFGLEGLVHTGEPKTSPHIRRACEFLLKHQNPLNGGWGEDFSSCYDKSYAKNGMRRFGDNGSSVVGTAWALLGLMAAEYEGAHTAIERGIKYLISRQLPNGDWPQEGILGVFNRTCGITYTNYRNIFPIWALGRYSNEYSGAMEVEL